MFFVWWGKEESVVAERDLGVMVQAIEGKVVLVNAVEACGGSRGVTPLFLNLTVVAEEWSASCPGHCTTRERTQARLPKYSIMSLTHLHSFVSSGIVPPE